MWKMCSRIAIVVFLILCSSVIRAQNTNSKSHQVELMKMMAGSWMCVIDKDTIAFWDAKSSGSGLIVLDKYIAKGNLVIEGKERYGYDKSIDKYLNAGMYKGRAIGIYVFWFVSDSTYALIQYHDIDNPEMAAWRVNGRFAAPDTVLETTLVRGKPVKTYTWIRVKK